MKLKMNDPWGQPFVPGLHILRGRHLDPLHKDERGTVGVVSYFGGVSEPVILRLDAARGIIIRVDGPVPENWLTLEVIDVSSTLKKKKRQKGGLIVAKVGVCGSVDSYSAALNCYMQSTAETLPLKMAVAKNAFDGDLGQTKRMVFTLQRTNQVYLEYGYTQENTIGKA